MKKKVLITISCFFILFVTVFVFYSGVIFQRGNPLPYVSKMLSLNDNNQYSKVYDNEDIYITRRSNTEEMIKHIESIYGVTFSEQMGSAYFFNSDDKSIIASTEVYWRKYLVWEIGIQKHNNSGMIVP